MKSGRDIGVKATNRSESRKRGEEYRPANKRWESNGNRNAYRHGLSRWDEAAGLGFDGFDAVLAEELNGADMDFKIWLKPGIDRIGCEL